MPPPKPKPQQDDSRSEASSTKEKAGNHSTTVNGKSRGTGKTTNAGSSLRDVVTASSSNAMAGPSGTATADAAPGVS